MAMPFAVELEGVADARAADAAIDAFHADLRWANDVFSLWDEHSPCSRLGRGETTLDECPREVREVFEACEWYRNATGGGFDARRRDGVLDPTGIVKAWAVARGARHLEASGASDWFVGASGDVLTAPGARKRRIGIADPRIAGDPEGSDVVDVIELGGEFRALATSGGAQDADHIWDPATGAPARHFAQVSVVGADIVACDAFATAIAGGGASVVERALSEGMQVLLVLGERPDGGLDARASDGWPSVLT